MHFVPLHQTAGIDLTAEHDCTRLQSEGAAYCARSAHHHEYGMTCIALLP